MALHAQCHLGPVKRTITRIVFLSYIVSSCTAAESGPAGYTFCFCLFFSFFFVYFFTIPVRSIISKSTGSILAKFSGLAELYTAVDDQSEVIFFNPSRDVAVTSFCRLYPHN